MSVKLLRLSGAIGSKFTSVASCIDISCKDWFGWLVLVLLWVFLVFGLCLGLFNPPCVTWSQCCSKAVFIRCLSRQNEDG